MMMMMMMIWISIKTNGGDDSDKHDIQEINMKFW
jgi:hypothetical protein